MILAFQLSDLITVPFGWLLGILYHTTKNYGVAMLLFAVLVQMILLPITAKSKKSMMKMSRLTPRIQDIQRRYPNDQLKQNELMQQLYKEEGVSMGGGCLWSFIPLLILFPLFAVIRQPITYILGEAPEVTQQIIDVIKATDPSVFGRNSYYDQVSAAQAIPMFAQQIKAAIPGISTDTLAGINFAFLGINMGSIPTINIFNASVWAWDWAHIGAVLIALLSAGGQVLSMFIAQKTNDSLVTNEKGVQDKEAAQNSQTAQTNKMMMYMMPLMSLWIGFTVPCALSLYWFVGGLIRTAQDTILTKHYRKIYDAEDAVRLARAMEQDRLEAEKERIRAERRAANPNGQTQNTSKKKLQKQQQLEEENARAAAAREYAAKKGIAPQEDEPSCMSGIPSRPYCRGRNYDPNRYNSQSTEE